MSPRAPSRPAPRRRGPTESVGELLPRVLGEVGLDTTARSVQLIHVWDEALGAEFAPHCRPAGVKAEVVHAHVRDSAWMQRIQLEKPRILERLGEALGEDPPRELRLRIAPLDERPEPEP